MTITTILNWAEMFSNDSISLEDRFRVYNMIVRPVLADLAIKTTDLSKLPKIFAIVYDFSSREVKTGIAKEMEDLKDLMEDLDSKAGGMLFDAMQKDHPDLKPKKDHILVAMLLFPPTEKVPEICTGANFGRLMFGPKGSLSASWFSFGGESIPETMGDPPKKEIPNNWFKESTLLGMIKDISKTQPRIKEFFNEPFDGSILFNRIEPYNLIIIGANVEGQMSLRKVDEGSFDDFCTRCLIAKDTQKSLKKKTAEALVDGKIPIIFAYMNYLRLYFAFTTLDQLV